MLVGRVLGAGRVGMRDPDGRQAQLVGEGVIGRLPPTFGGTAGSLPATWRRLVRANVTQGLSGSVREAFSPQPVPDKALVLPILRLMGATHLVAVTRIS